MKFDVILEQNREDRERYVTLVKYERALDGTVTPYRWTYEMLGGVLVSTRIQRLEWKQIRRERHMRTIASRGQEGRAEVSAA